jgi:hypothetical protein
MGATVPAPPILRRPGTAAFGQAGVVSEAKPVYIAPQQEFTSLAAMASEPAQPKGAIPPLPRRYMNADTEPWRIRRADATGGWNSDAFASSYIAFSLCS